MRLLVGDVHIPSVMTINRDYRIPHRRLFTQISVRYLKDPKDLPRLRRRLAFAAGLLLAIYYCLSITAYLLLPIAAYHRLPTTAGKMQLSMLLS